MAPDVHRIGPWGRTQTNMYLLRSGSTWALVDAGWAGDAPRITRAVQSLLGTDASPAAILLTHCHRDHAGAAAAGVPGMPDWEAVPTPGHTPGHLAFLRRRDRAC